MLDVLPLSQRDDRWKLKRLGYGTGTIGSYGCLLTSATIILNYFTGKNYTPDEVNEVMKANNGYTGETKNLWIWAVFAKVFPVEYTLNHSGSYDDADVKKWINKKIPVIIKVDGKPIGGLSHYVVAVGDGKIADPYFGDIRPFSTYTPLGYHVYTPTEQNDNMADNANSNALEACLALHGKLVAENVELKKDIETLKSEKTAQSEDFKTEKNKLETENKAQKEAYKNLISMVADILVVPQNEAQIKADLVELVEWEDKGKKAIDDLRVKEEFWKREKIDLEGEIIKYQEILKAKEVDYLNSLSKEDLSMIIRDQSVVFKAMFRKILEIIKEKNYAR